jgi:putative FmdB family regulatory protein
MPIYSYSCREYGEDFEQFRGIHDSDKEVACPCCGQKEPKRNIGRVFGGSSTSGSTRGNLTFPT